MIVYDYLYEWMSARVCVYIWMVGWYLKYDIKNELFLFIIHLFILQILYIRREENKYMKKIFWNWFHFFFFVSWWASLFFANQISTFKNFKLVYSKKKREKKRVALMSKRWKQEKWLSKIEIKIQRKFWILNRKKN